MPIPRGSPLALVLWLAFFSASAQDGASAIASIEAALRSQQYDQALAFAKASLQKRPTDFRIWTLQGIALSMKGDKLAALAAFHKALTLSPRYPAALKAEAQLLFQTGDKRAAPMLEQIVSIDPGDQTAQEMLALLEANAGECSKAVEHFELSKDAIPSHTASLERYGYCLTRLKRFDQAVPAFQQLAALTPDRPYATYDLALVLMQAGRAGEALRALEPLLAGQTSDPDVLSLASEVDEALGDTPNAVSLLRQAIVIEPTNADYYARFASLCLDHDSDQVGIDMLNAGLKRITNNSTLYIARGLLYSELSQFDKAEVDFQTAEALDPAQGLSSMALGVAEVRSGHPEQALATIRAQIRNHAGDPSLHYLLAKVLMDHGPAAGSEEFEEALHAALTAVRLKPDMVVGRDLLAGIYLKAGQNKLAIEQCRLALQTDPANQSAYYHLIMASRSQGDKAEIQELVKRLGELQQDARKRENGIKRYKLVEQDGHPAAQ
jgi:tetratricopeptide (TPR) repeat protein